MTNLERLKLADERERNARDAVIGFAAFRLPERVRLHFSGEEGREVFEHSAVFGNRVWPADREPKYGKVACRAHDFLISVPRFRKLLDSHENALMAWSEAHDRVQHDEDAYARDIDDMYRMIEREMWADVKEECRELGFVD
jgi:hypothetical protein